MTGLWPCISPLALGLLLGLPPSLSSAGSQGVTGAVVDDPALAAVIDPLAAEFHASLGKALVQAPQGLGRGHGDANPLGFWVADVLRERTQASLGAPVQAALTNNGGLRKDLAAGPVTAQDIYELMPFEDQIVVAEYTGAELIQLVRETLRFNGGEPFSGLQASLDGSPAQPRLRVTWSGGGAIDPAATYRLATSDYLFASGDSIPTVKTGRKPIYTGLFMRQLLLDECTELGQRKRELLPPPAGRLRVSPDLAQALRAKAVQW